MGKKSNSFLQHMEFHISKFVRETCHFDKSLFSSTGNVIISQLSDVHAFVYTFNKVLKNDGFAEKGKNISYLKAGLLNGMGLLDEIFHYVCRLYRRDFNPSFFSDAYAFINTELKKRTASEDPLFDLLLSFVTEFPPKAVYTKEEGAEQWLLGSDTASAVPNKILALEELLLLRLANENSAFEPFFILFNDEALRDNASYSLFWRTFKNFSAQQKAFGPENTDLISMLKKPLEFSPFSIKGQLQYVMSHWKGFLGDWLTIVLSGLDLIAEEEKQAWFAPAATVETSVYDFGNMSEEYEAFSQDKDWMPNVVLMAKSTLVWLDQLSKKYSKKISRLDQIPDEELAFLSKAGFNALWLIGIWERSRASARIKQLCGNPEAAASAYSLDSYEIAEELGGWSALEYLRSRAAHFGIRIAADMVPNHTAMDSRWLMERPDLFMQTRELPFPSYSFNGENLSHDSRVAVYLEDHYYSKQDCAVVFKRLDTLTGDVRYIYHGNDGTGLPWNDTAQLDFLNPETREAVIQEILNVAKNFKIIRLDAAMVLAKKHIQRLWYPQAGSGGAIASRSRYAMTNEEFNAKIPEEFWRELVDRCNSELPDTLLLAEAFWMMEGYFVRTLGMHRVYNSAFMNMLKREENEKYRMTIKNTLEFDPEVLKRYVNFMNNPDEDTAIAQFGSGDKYFGVCTMMVAMPGLPMFGHGQLEGFEEKYGMEYRRAYYNESPNEYLLERHKKEIFPLLRKRFIFSGVENFFLFDFWNNGLTNENVFAWSNYCAGQRSLIFYNNSYQRAFGWILISAAYAVKDANGEKQIQQKSLISALQLTNEAHYFTILHEQRSNSYFIRENTELAQNGFYAALDGFQCQVFWDIYEVRDNEKQTYKKICDQLYGTACSDINERIKELEFEELYTAIDAILTENYFANFLNFAKWTQLKSTSRLSKQSKKEIQSFIDDFSPKFEVFFKTILSFIDLLEQKNLNKVNTPTLFNQKTEDCLKDFLKMLDRFISFITDSFVPKSKLKSADKKFLDLLKKSLFTNKEDISIFAASIVLYMVQNSVTKYASVATAKNLLQGSTLDKKIASVLSKHGVEYNTAKQKLKLLSTIFTLEELLPENKTERPIHFIKECLNEDYLRSFLEVHEWKGEYWFNKERSEYLVLVSSANKILRNATIDDSRKARLYDLSYYSSVYFKLITKLEKSGYNVEKLSALLEEDRAEKL